MTHFIKRTFLKWFIIAIIMIALYPMGCYLYWSILAFGSSPQIVSQMEDSLKKLPSSVLIKKLNSIDFFSPYPTFAMNILAERKDKDATPALIKLLKSHNKAKRNMATWALSQINDERASEPLMNIVREGEMHPDYHEALLALSVMKYGSAFPYVLKEANKPDAYRNGSVAMLEAFGKPECVPILIDIKNRIKDSDPMPKFGRSLTDDAIKHIESLQKNKK